MKSQLLIVIGLFSNSLLGQSYFSKILDFGGDRSEGILYNVMPEDTCIKIIGLLHDSIIEGFQVGDWHVLGILNYNGIYRKIIYLVDSLYEKGFRYFTRPIPCRNDTICYLYDRRDIGNPFLDAYLIEFNRSNGRILRSKVIRDTISSQETFVARTIGLVGEDGLILINGSDQAGKSSQIATMLDSNWNIVQQKFIDADDRRYVARNVNVLINGNIQILGVSFGDDTPVWYESAIYQQHLNKDLESIEINLLESELDHTILLADAYPIIKSSSGDWIVASQEVVETNDCQGCSVNVPYVLSASPDFQTINWQTRMHEGDENSSLPYQYVQAVTEVSDGYIFISSRNGILGPETCGLLGKVSLSGDSLWTRKYIPTGWTEDQALWFNLKDIKTTPRGDIVVGGYGRDRFNEITVPWIMHLDKDGCLEPGCLSTSVSPEGDQLPLGLQVHPNPATDQVYIHIKAEKMTSPPYNLEVFTPDGKSVHSATIDFADTYYMLNVRSWAGSTYIIRLSDASGHTTSKQMVVNRG